MKTEDWLKSFETRSGVYEKNWETKNGFIIANMKSLKILVHSVMAYLCTILIIDKAFDVMAQRFCKTH